MRLIFDPPNPRDLLVVDDETLSASTEFDTSDARARDLLAQLHPDVREAPAAQEPPAPTAAVYANPVSSTPGRELKPSVPKPEPRSRGTRR